MFLQAHLSCFNILFIGGNKWRDGEIKKTEVLFKEKSIGAVAVLAVKENQTISKKNKKYKDGCIFFFFF